MPMMNWLSAGTQVTWILRDVDTGRENGDIEWTFQVGDLVKIRVFKLTRFVPPHEPPDSCPRAAVSGAGA